METPRPVTVEPASWLSLPSFLYGNPWFRVTPSFFVSFTSPAHTAERRHADKRPRSLRLPSRIPFLDARPRPGSFRLRRISSDPTARLRRKSTVCGLNGFLPSAKADGSLHLNPQPLRALAPPPLCAVLKRQLRFRFGNKNCASAHFSLQHGIQKIPGEIGEQRRMAQPKR
jgi:hypothetical protein